MSVLAILNCSTFFYETTVDHITTDQLTILSSFNFEQMGLITGIALAIILFLGFGAFSSLFTTDSEVLGIAWSGILVRNYLTEQCLFHLKIFMPSVC